MQALECDLYYIPKPQTRPLSKIVENQILEFVQKEAKNTYLTMSLENQAPSKEFMKKSEKDHADDILRSGNWKKIWQ